jgi:ribosomal protein S18 acetylase RimI-like enzyme
MPDDQPNLTIRPAIPDDVAQITRLDQETTGVAKPDYWRQQFDLAQRPENQQYFLVAEGEGQFLGFIIGKVRAWEFGSPPCGWIFALNVPPKLRLHGAGSALFEAVCARFRQAGVTKVRTMIARDAQLVMSFFRSQGLMAGPFIELEKDLDE